MSEASWSRLHPGSMAVNLVPRMWSLVRNLWPVLLAVLYGSSQSGGLEFLDLTVLFVFFGLAAWNTFLHWATLRYRVSDGRLEVRSGLLNKQQRVIAPERIQNIEMVRNVFHRMSGLVEVRIETASGREVEGLLSALTVDEATGLIDALGKARADTRVEDLPVIAENTTVDLVRYGMTAGRLGAIAVLIGVAAEWVQWSDPDQIRELGLELGTLGGVALLIGVVSGAFVLGIGSALLRHHGFRLSERDGALVATEGLLTRRQVELPLDKVQLVTVSEPVLRRALGFGSVHVETAAAREGQSGLDHSEAMIPVVHQDDFEAVVRAALPGLDVDLEGADLLPPHSRALLRGLVVATLQGLVVGSLLVVFAGWWGAAGFLLIPLGWVTAVLDHRFQGWLITDRIVIARRGWWTRVTQVVDRRKMQSLVLSQGPFLRNYGLGVLGVRVAGSAVVLPILDFDEAYRVQQGLLHGRST